MSFEWRELPLGECLLKVVDNRGKTPPLAESKTPYGLIEVNALVGPDKSPNYSAVRKFVSAETYNSWFRSGHPVSGDLLFSTVGSVAEVALFNGGSGCIAQNIVGLRPNTEIISPNYLYYALVNPVMQLKLRTLDISSVQPSIKVPHLLAAKIQVPPLHLQEPIGEILEALDDRITLLRETNATLEAIAQALFKSWFVDFDPVRAKAEGRARQDGERSGQPRMPQASDLPRPGAEAGAEAQGQPEGAIQGSMSAAEGRMPKAAMDATTAALFPDSFEESELGLVPKGWKVGTLGDIAQTARQQMQVSELHADLHYVGLEHIPRKSLSLTSWGNAEGLESAKAAFSEGDVLFGKLRPYFHKVVISPFAGVCSTDILVCQPRIQNYFGVVAMHLFSETLINYADRLSNGAKMPRVNWKDLAAYQIVIPPAELAEKLNEAIHPLIARMMENTHQAQTLTQLRDTLLPRLISGQLRLPEAQEQLEEALV